MDIETVGGVYDWVSKQQIKFIIVSVTLMLPNNRVELLPGHDGKMTLDINFILSPYCR